MVGPEVEVGCRNGSHAPLSLRREGLALVVARCRDNDLVSVLVDRTRGGGGDLRLLLGLLLYLSNLLPLL